jgi:prolyl oligopeptidase PreP (S9A serine peptidase family)
MTTKIPVELSSTPSIVDNGDATAITIDSSENVGIGMTPFTGYTGYSLQIGGTSQTFISIHNTTTGNTVNDGFSLGNDASNVYLTNRENTPMIFSTNNTERMRIGSDGKVLINTTSTVGTSTALVEFNNLGSGGRILNTKDNGTGSCNAITFNNNNGQVGRITTDGSGTSYVTSSDYRMKENLVYEWEAISKIKNLKPVQFNFKTNPDELTEGFIAHEAQSIVPYAIVGEKDGEEMQGMDYGKLTAVLTKAIQEQQEQIEALQSEINTLKGG